MILQMEFFFVFFLIFFIIFLLACCIPIIMCVWVYGDAKKRGMDEAIWLIIVLFTGILGLIIYLIVRDPLLPEFGGTPAAVSTPTYPTQTSVQPQYGTQQQKASNPIFCPTCGAKMESTAKFCNHCGQNLEHG